MELGFPPESLPQCPKPSAFRSPPACSRGTRGWPYLHLAEVGEVAGGDLMLPLNLLVDLAQVVHQLFLLALLPKDIGHLLLEGADDVGVDL